jgi:hypothetical protein
MVESPNLFFAVSSCAKMLEEFGERAMIEVNVTVA